MSVKSRVSALTLLQVWAMEGKIRRWQKRQKKLRDEKQEIYHRLSEIEDEDLAIDGRVGDLESKIELSGVYDD